MPKRDTVTGRRVRRTATLPDQETEEAIERFARRQHRPVARQLEKWILEGAERDGVELPDRG